MKKVEYTCDVCDGPLVSGSLTSWIEMVLGSGVFRFSLFGRKKLDVCNECWEDCKFWVFDQIRGE